MKLSPIIAAMCCTAALAVSGCATAPRFEWGNYDQELYAYSKRPERGPQFEAALVKAIAQGRKTNRLAPGLQAELGYLYLADGKSDAAIVQFEAEMRDFPESRSFLTKIVAEGARK